MSRELEILEAAWSANYGSPVYDKSHLKYNYESLVLSAMRELARERSIGFAEWVIHESTWNITQGNFDWAKTTDQLYSKYIESLNIK